MQLSSSASTGFCFLQLNLSCPMVGMKDKLQVNVLAFILSYIHLSGSSEKTLGGGNVSMLAFV